MTTNRRWLIVMFVIGAALIVGVGGLYTAAKIEENDAFCASCHTRPEVTYYARSVEARVGKPVDLASAHAAVPQAVRCIDCHSDEGVRGRLGALMLGAGDAARWISGTSREPHVTTAPLGDGHCLKCHTPVLADESFDGHYHRLMPRWRELAAAQGAPYAGCIGCHSSHTTDGNAQAEFMRMQRTQQVCDQCHVVMKKR